MKVIALGRKKYAAVLLVVMPALSTEFLAAPPASAAHTQEVITRSAEADPVLPDPGSKAKSPRMNVSAYPKLTDQELADRVARDRKADSGSSEAGPSTDVTSAETLPDGRVRVDLYTPAPGVTAEQLAASLQAEGKKNVQVARHIAAEADSDVEALAPGDCTYGQAHSVTCPVSYWTNMGRVNPVVAFNDHSGAAWPTDNAVYKWNRTPNIDSWYYWNYCPQYENVHCVDVHSANYGATNWYGHTTRYYIPPTYGRMLGAHIELNDYYGQNGTTYNHVVTHEMGHALGLGHNDWGNDVMYTTVNMREDIGGENPELLRSIYSIDR
ncbi:M57 family metalloprotease [Nonomuraea zeae]|uniref:Matrixin family metalloprotease n=1 Tax=Nonomuraea zeae TaxID=1642303 RepID=A0A5S4G8Y5_9ACTN|nr:M57 family metalloprotease [Nonomuraea zeae]TMR29476.1 matrixin family metalloprotease [Nonomuraea zeae]